VFDQFLKSMLGQRRSSRTFLLLDKPVAFRYVTDDLRYAANLPLGIEYGRNGERHGNPATVLPNPCRLDVVYAAAASELFQKTILVRPQFGRDEHRNRPSKNFLCSITKYMFRSSVPAHDDAVQRLAHNGVIRRFDDCGEPVRRLKRSATCTDRLLRRRAGASLHWVNCLQVNSILRDYPAPSVSLSRHRRRNDGDLVRI